MSQRKHSLFGPSSLRRRSLCPGSYRLEKDAPPNDSADARRGTDLHGVVANVLLLNEEMPASLSSWDAQAVTYCVDAVRAVTFGAELHGEVAMGLMCLHPEIAFGTADLVAVRIPMRNHADIFEFKFGQIQEPEARENMQLAAYAYGVRQKFDVETVSVWLIQPATGHTSHYEYGANSFTAIKVMAENIVARALAADASCIPGEDQCRYCRGAAICPALHDVATTLPVKVEPATLAPAHIGRLLDQAILAEKFIERLREYALTKAQFGDKIPGWTLGEGRKTREWAMGADEELAKIASRLNKPVAALHVVSMATPSQLEAAWGKAKPVREALAEFIVERPGRPCLKKEGK